MEPNNIILDYIRSLFENELDQDIVTRLWECEQDGYDELLQHILDIFEEKA